MTAPNTTGFGWKQPAGRQPTSGRPPARGTDGRRSRRQPAPSATVSPTASPAAGDHQNPPLATASPTASPTASTASPTVSPTAGASAGGGDRQPLATGDRQHLDGPGEPGQFIAVPDGTDYDADYGTDYRTDYGTGRESSDFNSSTRPGRVVGAAGQWVDSLRFVNEPLGSLRELLRFAKHAHYSLGHVPIVRAANIAFFWLVTAPVLTAIWFLSWAFLIRLHRSVTAWGIVLVSAPFANRLADVVVLDAFDVTLWSVTTWQCVAGALLVFVLTTVGVLLGGRKR